MEGLNSAAASSEYSWLKYEPSNSFRSSESFRSARKHGRDLFKPALEELVDLRVAFAEFGLHLRPQRVDLAFGKGHDLGADSDGARGRRFGETDGAAPACGPDAVRGWCVGSGWFSWLATKRAG